MRITYDSINDIVSAYFDVENADEGKPKALASAPNVERSYEVDEAADLILDMLDLTDNKGNFIGFRVFNASKHYELDLLNHADKEELPKSELEKLSKEKVIAKYHMENDKLISDNS